MEGDVWMKLYLFRLSILSNILTIGVDVWMMLLTNQFKLSNLYFWAFAYDWFYEPIWTRKEGVEPIWIRKVVQIGSENY